MYHLAMIVAFIIFKWHLGTDSPQIYEKSAINVAFISLEVAFIILSRFVANL
jgi:hypothetical protein